MGDACEVTETLTGVIQTLVVDCGDSSGQISATLPVLLEARYNNSEVATVYDRNRDGVVSAGDVVEATTTPLDCDFESEGTAVLDVLGTTPTANGVRILLPPTNLPQRSLDITPYAISQVGTNPGIVETGTTVNNFPADPFNPSGLTRFFRDLDPNDNTGGQGSGKACSTGRVDVSGPAL